MADEPQDPAERPARPNCRATTKLGKPCTNKACAGSAYCASHGGGKRPIGRRAKLDEALINSLGEAVERGVTWKVAARACGIGNSTLHEWRARGEDDIEAGNRTVYAELVDRLMRADAEAERLHVENIRVQGAVDWRASAFWLERRRPEDWARRDRLDVDVTERAKPRTVTPEEPARDAILALLATATRPPAGLENTP